MSAATSSPAPLVAPRRGLYLLLWLVVLSPSLLYWLRLPDVGQLPSNDYYGVLRDLATAEGEIDTRPATWLDLRSNEHRVMLPGAIYLLNLALTDGDNRGLVVWVLLVLTLTLVLLVSFLPAAVRDRPATFLGCGLLLSLLVFNPVQAHNVLRAFSGVMWLTANLLAVVALWALVRSAGDPRRRWLVVALTAGIAAGFTYSSHLSLWPALLVAGLVLALPRRRLAAIAVAAALVYLAAWATFPQVASTPELAGASTLDEVRFALVYLGSPFSREVAVAAALGLAGLAAAVAFWTRALPPLAARATARAGRDGHDPRQADRRRRQLAPWLAVGLYAASNAAGTALGRAAGGIDWAFHSRYANLAALFWIGLLVPLALDTFVRRAGPDGRSREGARPGSPHPAGLPGRPVLATLLLAVLAIALAARGLPIFDGILESHERQPVAALALVFGVEDEGAARFVTMRPQGLWEALPVLRAQGHVPFDGPPAIPWLGEPLPAELRGERGMGVTGFLERVEPVGERVVKVRGWVGGEAGRVERLLLTDGRGVVRGAAWPIQPRRGDGVGDGATTWLGFARRPRGTGRLIAWAEPAGARRLVPLPRVGGGRAGTDRAIETESEAGPSAGRESPGRPRARRRSSGHELH